MRAAKFCAIGALTIAIASCAGAQWDDPDPTHTVALDDDFAVAAESYGVPVDLAKAVAYTETRWNMVAGAEENDGHRGGDGVFALWGANLDAGAHAAGVSTDNARVDVTANIAAGTAQLGALAGSLRGTTDLAAWAPVVEQFAQSDDADVRHEYARDVYQVLVSGAEEIGEDGGLVASLEPHPELAGLYGGGQPRSSGSDYAGAIFRASPNYSSRSGSSIDLIVIHTCEGAYAGCWGYLKQSSSQVSAHYVVKENGSEITQLVKESSKAWHVAANYACSRNANTMCARNGASTNTFAIGVEHAGFASQGSWPDAQIEASAKLVCDIAKRNNIPRDRTHIVGHGQLQPNNRTDPGPNWPWDHYISRVRAYCGDDGAPPPSSTPPSGGIPSPTMSDPIVVDSNQSRNDDTVARIELTGTWSSMTAVSGYYGTGYWQASTASTSEPATFSFYVATPGPHTIDAWWTAGSNRSSATPFIAFDSAGAQVGRVDVDQRANGSQWNALGTWNFKAGWNSIAVSRWAPGSVVVADAIRVR
ncbi:MAG TPA: N-acetylmuramoyl-L-alanine amidase [Kofleriaceae bacterium]|jgi:hypothetical protein